jgi:hypothetical protein
MHTAKARAGANGAMRTRWISPVLVALLLFLACAGPHPIRPDPPSAGFIARAQEYIAAREYHASENGEGLEAPNRAHNLRTYFATTGIRVNDRTAGGGPSLLRLSLSGVGREGALVAVEPGTEVVTNESRVEIQRSGLVEWFVNSPAGLEQGFTLEERPAGEGPLIVELAVAGAKPSLRGDEIVFESHRRTLRYGELVVADAREVPVAGHFELASADRLWIVVDDARATYPLVIDPLLTGIPDTRLDSDLVTFGTSSSGAGDVNGDGYADVIVGAPGWDVGVGAAFVFHGSASGIASGDALTAAAILQSNQNLAHRVIEWVNSGQIRAPAAYR